MGNIDETRILLGSLRYKSAPNTTIGLKVPLIQTFKENVEFDRSVNIELQQVFNDERQKSTIFRPTGKFTLLFKNAYSGTTTYNPLKNNLYYIDTGQSLYQQCQNGTNVISRPSFPDYNEFDFIRTDYKTSGYTIPDSNGEYHRLFIPKSATSYNWNFFMSYAYENDYNKTLSAVEPKSGINIIWKSGDGIPFVIYNTFSRGLDVIAFRCPVKHGVTVGEYIKLSFSYLGTDTFQVFSLGDGTENSDEYIVNIINVGYLNNVFNNGVKGTFKRIIDRENPNDTISEYYIVKNKILTNPEDAVLVNAGFEQNIFGVTKKYQGKALSPNQQPRVSIKEGSQCYTLTFSTDIDIAPIRDNHKRPISELFFTVMWKGYFGLMFGNLNNNLNYIGLKQGYDFNLPLINKLPSNWWDTNNSLSDTNFSIGTYTNSPLGNGLGPNGSQLVFRYIKSLKKNDIVDGNFCEWNNYRQTERVISNPYHKLTYNRFVFKTETNPSTNPFGYYYSPHHSITIRDYSDYVESGDKNNVEGVPDYSYFSKKENAFLWRDLYEYGYIDANGIGVNYPFINGKHYPYQSINFRIIPEGTNYRDLVVINDPIIDPCE